MRLARKVADGATLPGSAVVAVAIVVMNVATYAMTITAARILGPTAFGEYSAALGVLLVVNVVSLGLQATGARRVSVHGPDAAPGVIAAGRRAAIVVTLGMAALTPAVEGVLHLDAPASAVAMALTAGALTWVGALAGVLQGARRWSRLSVVFVAIGLGRWLLGLFGLVVRPSTLGALSGISVGALVALAVAHVATRSLRRTASERGQGRAVLIEVGHSTHALLAFFVLSNVDVIVARAAFDTRTAGLFAAGLILTKGVLFLPLFVSVVAFPAMATSPGERSVVARPLALVLGLGVGATAGVAILPGLALAFVGGRSYDPVADRLWVFALAGCVLSGVQFLVYGAVARQQNRTSWWLWTASTAFVGGALLVTTLDGLIMVRLATACVALVLIGLATWRALSTLPVSERRRARTRRRRR